jgi:hypothetical protein
MCLPTVVFCRRCGGSSSEIVGSGYSKHQSSRRGSLSVYPAQNAERHPHDRDRPRSHSAEVKVELHVLETGTVIPVGVLNEEIGSKRFALVVVDVLLHTNEI